MRRIRLDPARVTPYDPMNKDTVKDRPGMALLPSKSNPRVRRWQQTDSGGSTPKPNAPPRTKSGRVKRMRKGRALIDVGRFMAGKPRVMRKAWDPKVKPVTWRDGDVLFTFRKATSGVGVLSCRWPESDVPYHIVAPDLETARADAVNVVDALRKGRTPERGVFRREDAPRPRRRTG